MSFAPVGSQAAPKVVSGFFEQTASLDQASRIAEIEAAGLPYGSPDARSTLSINGSNVFIDAVGGSTPKARVINAIRVVASTLQSNGLDQHMARELATLLCHKGFVENDETLVGATLPDGIQLGFAGRHVNVTVKGKSAVVHRMSEWQHAKRQAQHGGPDGKPVLTVDSGISVYLEKKGKSNKPLMTVRPDFWIHGTDDPDIDKAMREPLGQTTLWERFVNLLADVVGRAGFRFETATRLDSSQRELLQQYRGIESFSPARRNLIAIDLGAGVERSYAVGPLEGLDDAGLKADYEQLEATPNPSFKDLDSLIRKKAQQLIPLYERALRHEDAEAIRKVLDAKTNQVAVALAGQSPVALCLALIIEANEVRDGKYPGGTSNRLTMKALNGAVETGTLANAGLGADDVMQKMSGHFSQYRAMPAPSPNVLMANRLMTQSQSVLAKFPNLRLVRRLERMSLAGLEASVLLQKPPVSGQGPQVLPVSRERGIQSGVKPALTEVDDAALMFLMGMSADEVKQQLNERKRTFA